MPSVPPLKPKRSAFPVPWGLLAALGVYALLVLAYVYVQYWSSPTYIATRQYQQALIILGLDNGEKCTEAQLHQAFELLLEAARVLPTEKEVAERIERLRWQFERRHFKLSEDYRRKAELVSAAAHRVEQERQPLLVIGARDYGWAPEQLLSGPRTAMLWSIPGAGLIVLFWAYLRFVAHRVRARDREEDLQQVDAEIREAGRYRDGLEALRAKQRPLKSASLQRTPTITDVDAPTVPTEVPPED